MHLKERFDAFYGCPKSSEMADMLDNWQICRSGVLLYYAHILILGLPTRILEDLISALRIQDLGSHLKL